MPQPRAQRTKRRTIWRRARRYGKRTFAGTAGALAPSLYRAWMGFVWHTSRRVDHGLDALLAEWAGSGRLVLLMWHEEIFAAPYVYARLGIRAHVLVSRSGIGEFAARISKACGHAVSRGGSSRRGSRFRPTAIRGAIRWMRERDDGVFATPIDGSHGPRYRMKPGSLLVARACGARVVCVRVWFQRCIRLPTWDRAVLPLPFGEIHTYGGEPRPLPIDSGNRDELEAFRVSSERELVDLTVRSHADTGTPVPARLAGPPSSPSAPQRRAAHAGRKKSTRSHSA
ncbi:MAG: DUF374 domain-containing protein [Myxococcota bacterium]|nr:hypothetical protein [Deltaproteobacteria bacterium]MCP4244370.1 DUF374 domain-containing protein [bacterium]MDP6074844.1 DUF374 domain-containing protein [Myxococcota bacterium]MDP6244676.1 DUF374 domain-containing protein [Myxococcota bacterium]MDP7075247.1 DUF374 domain-containing protein [Myxococcota bacterium]